MITSWSRKYYGGLTDAQHQANDAWFERSLALLTDRGVLIVPNLQLTFNKRGECLESPRVAESPESPRES